MTRIRPGSDLSDLTLFGPLSERELARADRLLTRVSVRAGAELCREGALGQEAFVLLEGTATVERGGATVATVGRGDVVGEMALLEPPFRRTATVRAVTDVTVLAMNSREFDALLDVGELGEEIRRIADGRSQVA